MKTELVFGSLLKQIQSKGYTGRCLFKIRLYTKMLKSTFGV